MNKTLKVSLIILAALAGTALLVGLGFAIGHSIGVSREALAFRQGMSDRYNDLRNQRSIRPGQSGRQPRIPQGNIQNLPNCAEGALCGPLGAAGTTTGEPLTVEAVQSAAQEYLVRFNNSDLTIAEIMIFDNNGYVVVKETSTGKGAFELLVYPGASIAIPEFGPTRMWNIKYGMMGGRGGMMNWQVPQTDTLPSTMVDVTKAASIAQEYLDANIPGAIADATPIEFYGYYSFDYSIDGKIAGMLSVNANTGRVWLHTWHGTFINEWEAE